MKFFYMICLLLSSFFTYKHLSADSNIGIYAFFIPENSFQQNVSVKQLNNPTIKKQTNTETSTNNTNSAQTVQQTLNTPSPKTDKPIKKTTKKTATNATSQYSQNNKKTNKSEPMKKKDTQSIVDTAIIQEKLKKYNLDEYPLPTEPQQPITTTNPTATYNQKSIKEMLDTLPYPDFNQPKFKQLYALYGLELKSLYRRGKFPVNQEQDKTLAKANSLHRFEVK